VKLDTKGKIPKRREVKYANRELVEVSRLRQNTGLMKGFVRLKATNTLQNGHATQEILPKRTENEKEGNICMYSQI
jgi:hypothetical protein